MPRWTGRARGRLEGIVIAFVALALAVGVGVSQADAWPHWPWTKSPKPAMTVTASGDLRCDAYYNGNGGSAARLSYTVNGQHRVTLSFPRKDKDTRFTRETIYISYTVPVTIPAGQDKVDLAWSLDCWPLNTDGRASDIGQGGGGTGVIPVGRRGTVRALCADEIRPCTNQKVDDKVTECLMDVVTAGLGSTAVDLAVDVANNHSVLDTITAAIGHVSGPVGTLLDCGQAVVAARNHAILAPAPPTRAKPLPQVTVTKVAPLPAAPSTTRTSARTTAPRSSTTTKPASRTSSTPPPPPPAQYTLTVYNKVTNGSTQMREDTPAYLTTVPRGHCTALGCNIAGTGRNTGGTWAPAVCQTTGERITNGEDGSSIDDHNPGLYTSDRYYGVRLSGGGLGYTSEVWVIPSQRGGLGLPHC